MAHLAVETLRAQIARELGEGKGKHEREDFLRAFGKRTISLCNELHQFRPLNEVEFLFMDNHFQVLQMAYLRWKQKHGELSSC